MLASPGVGPDITGKSSPEVYSANALWRRGSANALGEERFQMRYRIAFIVGLAVGYVLGTKAGRERYEQLQKMARQVRDNPSVQQAAGAVQAQAAGYAKTARGKLAEGAGAAKAKVGGALHERVPGMRTRDANGHASGSTDNYASVPQTPGGPPTP
jgi:hypothetical protein